MRHLAKDGSVTAGNSSTLNDGASAVIVCTRQAAEDHGLTPMAKIRSAASAGVDPTTMGFGPVPATQLALKRARMTVADLELVELNEAFAAQSLGVIRKLGLKKISSMYTEVRLHWVTHWAVLVHGF